MNGGKLLMMINFFPPAAGGGVYRPLSFVRHLSSLGWEITVITPRPGEFWITDPDLERMVPSGVRVIRTRSLSGQRFLGGMRRGAAGSRRSSPGFGALRRLGEFFLLPDTYVGWAPFAFRAASALCRSERFDAIYSTSPPDSTHMAAMAAARRFSIPWVADFRDPWISLYLRKPPTGAHAWLHRRMEGRVAAADRVVVATSWQKSVMEERHPGCRVEHIPNGFDEDDFAGAAPPVNGGGIFTVLHCGMLTLGRTSGSFLRGLALLAARRPELRGRVSVVFLGARESANEEWVSRLGLGDMVRFQDSISHGECVRLERESSALLLIKHDDERYAGLIPGKLFEYIGARRPVIAVVPEGEAAGIIRRERRGEVVSHGDTERIACAIERMYDLHREGRLSETYSLGELPAYSRREAAASLDRLLRGMAGPKEGRE